MLFGRETNWFLELLHGLQRRCMFRDVWGILKARGLIFWQLSLCSSADLLKSVENTAYGSRAKCRVNWILYESKQSLSARIISTNSLRFPRQSHEFIQDERRKTTASIKSHHIQRLHKTIFWASLRIKSLLRQCTSKLNEISLSIPPRRCCIAPFCAVCGKRRRFHLKHEHF